MALTAYITETQRLLQNPGAPTTLYSVADITVYINTARGQLAAEGECVRALASLTTVASQQIYPFTSITGLPSGVGGVFSVRQMSAPAALGFTPMYGRPWAWMQQYYIGQPVPKTGLPVTWAQLATGVTGNFAVYPVPDAAYTLALDVVGRPISLVDDTTPEAIPALFTDAIPYVAAYRALLSSQRTNDADGMFKLYSMFLQRARTGATPGVLSGNYNQVPDVTMGNKIGSSGAAGGAR